MTSSRTRSASLCWTSALALFLSLLAAPAAYAHAALKHAAPAAGAVLDKPPVTVTIEYSQAIDLTQIELTLHAEDGTAIELTAPANEAKSGTTIERKLKSTLPPGLYEIKWRVLSIDGHHTRGAYTFEVTAAAPN